MSLDQLANIAEIIAAVLVIVSLIYVGLQIRQNTEASRLTAAQAYTDSYIALLSSVVTTPNLTNVMHRGLADLSTLDDDETVQFVTFMDQVCLMYQSFFYQRERGVLNRPLFNMATNAMIDLLAAPGMHQYWATRRHWYDQEFQAYLDNLLSTAETKAMFPSLATV